jgi:hypothetical protein
MGSNSKEARSGQKAYWENKLNERLSVLNDQGLESGRISKDNAVRKIRAKIRGADARLQVIADLEKKVADMAKAKAEKAAEAKNKKAKSGKASEKTPEMSKRQQKKKAKKEKKEKEKKTEA